MQKVGSELRLQQVPPTQITAPELQRQGIYAHKSIVESRKVRGGTGNEDRAIPRKSSVAICWLDSNAWLFRV